MFWKRVRRIVDGLRFKAVLGFGALLAASAVLCWVSTSRILERSLRRELDRRLDIDLDRLERTFVTGRERPRRGRRIPESAVTDQELIALQTKFPGGKLLQTFERAARHGRFRLFYLAVDGEIFMARLNADGSVYSRLLPREERSAALAGELAARVRGDEAGHLRLRYWDPQGKLAAAAPERSPAGKFALRTRRLFDGSRLEAGRSTGEMEALLKELRREEAGVFLTFLAVIIPCTWLFSRQLLSGVVKVSSAARRIADSGDFDCRVDLRGGGSEIGELVRAFNTMNDHNKMLFNEVRNVTDNVAHELKTPLARLHGAAEIALGESSGSGPSGELAAVVAEECAEMLSLINSMLEITRTEAGLVKLEYADVDLCEMLRRARELFLPLAEDLRSSFELETPPEAVRVTADRMKLERVFANLIDNALKFSNAGGRLSVSVARHGDSAVVTVADTGCGIAEADLPHIFERLYRCDASRARPGSGLGLSLAAAIVRAHRGGIGVTSSPGKGTTFTVTLPASPEVPK